MTSNDKRTTSLDSLSNIDDDSDYLVVVDVSDLTSGLTGTTKKVNPSDLLGNNLKEIKDTAHTGDEIFYSDSGVIKAGDAPTIRNILGLTSSTYTHVQTFDSNSWLINHNLGFRPSVEIFSIGGLEIEGNVVHNNLNQININFSIPIQGSARLT